MLRGQIADLKSAIRKILRNVAALNQIDAGSVPGNFARYFEGALQKLEDFDPSSKESVNWFASQSEELKTVMGACLTCFKLAEASALQAARPVLVYTDGSENNPRSSRLH